MHIVDQFKARHEGYIEAPDSEFESLLKRAWRTEKAVRVVSKATGLIGFMNNVTLGELPLACLFMISKLLAGQRVAPVPLPMEAQTQGENSGIIPAVPADGGGPSKAEKRREKKREEKKRARARKQQAKAQDKEEELTALASQPIDWW